MRAPLPFALDLQRKAIFASRQPNRCILRTCVLVDVAQGVLNDSEGADGLLVRKDEFAQSMTSCPRMPVRSEKLSCRDCAGHPAMVRC